MISPPQFKEDNRYLTSEGYPLGTTCWFTVVEHKGYRFICCGATPKEAEDRGKLIHDMIEREYSYVMLRDTLDSWRPKDES